MSQLKNKNMIANIPNNHNKRIIRNRKLVIATLDMLLRLIRKSSHAD